MKARNIKYKILTITLVTLSVFCVHAQTITNYTSTDGLVDNSVNCLAVDHNNHVWFGTKNGISKFDGTNWTTHNTTTDTGIISDNVTAICATADNDIWIGTNSGISHFNGTKWVKYSEKDGLGNNRVNSIIEGPNKKIWISENSGFTVMDGSTWTTYSMTDGLPFGGISDIAFDSSGAPWLGTSLGGIIHFNGTKFDTYDVNDGLVSNVVNCIVVDKNQTKWIGTADGLATISANFKIDYHGSVFRLPDPDTLNPIIDIALIDDITPVLGIYIDYLVTEGGVAWWDTDIWGNITPDDGLVGPVVREVALDSGDNIWVATSTGVSKIDKLVLSSKEISMLKMTLYPNPSNGTVHLKLDQDLGDVEVIISDLQGRNLQTESYASSKNIELNLDVVSGIYLLHVYTSSGAKITKRLVVR